MLELGCINNLTQRWKMLDKFKRELEVDDSVLYIPNSSFSTVLLTVLEFTPKKVRVSLLHYQTKPFLVDSSSLIQVNGIADELSEHVPYGVSV